MKNLFLLLTFCSTVLGDPLGVLYESSNTNNTVSPSSLSIPNLKVDGNLNVVNSTGSQAVALNAAKILVGSLLSNTQQDQLASIVGATNILNLGAAQILSGTSAPTNGTAGSGKYFYINTGGSTINDTYWGNVGTTWYPLASTNGGSITESQLVFTDNTTADATAFKHGLLMKLDGNPAHFLNGVGGWINTAQFTGNTNQSIPVVVGNTAMIAPTNFSYDIASRTLSVLKINVGNNGFYQGGGNSQISVDDARFNALADVTTGDVDTTHHGFVPKAPGDSSKFLNGIGGWSVPPGGGGGGIAVTGTPVDGNITFWTGTNSVTGVSSFRWDQANQTLHVPVVQDVTSITTGSITVGTGDNQGTILSGTYVPTYSGASGVSTLGNPNTFKYTRTGNLVHVSGAVYTFKNSVSTTVYSFNLSLPIAPTPSVNQNQLTGVASSSDNTSITINVRGYGFVHGDTTTAKVIVNDPGSTGTARMVNVVFDYTITN